METRLANLLRAVVEEYIATAQPVGSQSLVDRRRLDVSPATIRNWFAELEELGYLTHSHTSGGRIPTEKGYQTYIELFIQPKRLAKRDQAELEKEAAVSPRDEGRRLKSLAKALADLSGQATVMGMRDEDTFYTGLAQLFAQPEFKDLQRVINLTESLDHLDEAFDELRHRHIDAPMILVGKDCPFGSSCGAIVITTDDAIIGILGPIRMDYQYAFSLLASIKEILS